MEILIYSKPENMFQSGLKTAIEENLLQNSIVVHDLGQLFETIRTRLSSDVFIVFVITVKAEIDCLIHCREKFSHSDFILILPELENDLATKGLMLHPRYMAYPSRNFEDVCSVLEKIIVNQRRDTIKA